MLLVVFLPELLGLVGRSTLQTIVVVILDAQHIHPVVLHLVLALVVEHIRVRGVKNSARSGV